jgi:hypothetical protein
MLCTEHADLHRREECSSRQPFARKFILERPRFRGKILFSCMPLPPYFRLSFHYVHVHLSEHGPFYFVGKGIFAERCDAAPKLPGKVSMKKIVSKCFHSSHILTTSCLLERDDSFIIHYALSLSLSLACHLSQMDSGHPNQAVLDCLARNDSEHSQFMWEQLKP